MKYFTREETFGFPKLLRFNQVPSTLFRETADGKNLPGFKNLAGLGKGPFSSFKMSSRGVVNYNFFQALLRKPARRQTGTILHARTNTWSKSFKDKLLVEVLSIGRECA